MKLKTVEVDGKQYAEILEGKPVYVEDDGKEVAFDAAGQVVVPNGSIGFRWGPDGRTDAGKWNLESKEGRGNADVKVKLSVLEESQTH